ncbi:MAG: helix-turn-helix transcriptional regulator [Hyphomicrobiales bacterium]|nr:helix-turn-helix transcriptional regulator [Hyphomicrobiales bacterium]
MNFPASMIKPRRKSEKNEVDTESIDAHVGARIKIKRESLRLSQEKLGEHIGVTFQQVQKYERGANRIGAGQLYHIAKFLSVDPGYFYKGLTTPSEAGFAEPQSPMAMAEDSDPSHELSQAFSRILSKRLRKKIVDLVNAIADSDASSRSVR